MDIEGCREIVEDISPVIVCHRLLLLDGFAFPTDL